MGGESHEIIIHFQQANWNCFLRGWSMLRLKVALELLIADPCILIGAILSTDLHSVHCYSRLLCPLLPLFARYFLLM